MVHSRDDVVGLDSSIVTTPSVHKASGHVRTPETKQQTFPCQTLFCTFIRDGQVENFSDPMVDCKESKQRLGGRGCAPQNSRAVSAAGIGPIS